MNAIPAEVIRRVFPVLKQNDFKEIWGTAFTIKEKGKEFLVTAYHVANHHTNDIEEHTEKIRLIVGKEDKKSERIEPQEIIEKLLYVDKEHDIIICEAPKWTYENRENLPSLTSSFVMNQNDGISLGQDVMWMGYPKGFSGGKILPDTYTPIGIVGKGVLGGFQEPKTKLIQDQRGIIRKGIIIEGRIDGGYSGGPVVYKSLQNPQGPTYVEGVISGSVGGPEENSKRLENNLSFIIAGDLSKVMKKVHQKLNHQ